MRYELKNLIFRSAFAQTVDEIADIFNSVQGSGKQQMQYGSITEEEYKKICVLISKKAKQATRNHDYFLNGYIDELKMKALKEELKSA